MIRFRIGTRLATFLASAALPTAILAQPGVGPGDYGDAPEGQAAYPAVPGLFPTCFGGPGGFIYHWPPFGAPNAWFGLSVDFELDGNGGLCAPPPYEQDECYGLADLDAGLTLPTGFTYDPGGLPITCSGLPGRSLARPCTLARWGTDVDIYIHNDMNIPAYFNVLVDLDHSGDWSPFPVGPFCGPQIPEHVVRNVPVPPNFHGLASMLPVADFMVGPDSGLVWARFTLTPDIVLFPWSGAGVFEKGETEDYLLRVGAIALAAEYGDAPQGAPAYPPSSVVGRFPTCVATGSYIEHQPASLVYLGNQVDYEGDGNASVCVFPDYDRDECFGAPDAGLVAPRPFTISATHTIVPCSAPGTALGRACEAIGWGTDFDVRITNAQHANAYFNLLVDWDHDGAWGGIFPGCPVSAIIEEHVLQNLVVPPGFNGLLSQLNPPPQKAGGRGFAWARLTVTSTPITTPWDGSGTFLDGETEDYLLLVGAAPTGTEDSRLGALQVSEPSPNPARAGTSVELTLPHATRVAGTVYDAAGRIVRDLGGVATAAGTHRVDWDGRNNAGKRVSTGTYFVRIEIGAESYTRRVLLLR